MGSITAPDRMCAPTSLPFSRMQTRELAPGVAGQLLQADRSAESRRTARRRSPRHRPWIRVRSSVLSASLRVASRVPHISTQMPCQFLDRGVNGRRGMQRGRGSGIDRHRRGAQRIGLVARGRGRRRRAGRAARLAETRAAPKPQPKAQPSRAAECRPAQLTRRSPSFRNGWRAAPSFRSRPRRRGGSCRTGPENAAIMLLSDAPTLEDFAAGQPIGGEVVGARQADARRDQDSRRASLQRLALLLPCARREDERRRARSLRRDRAPHIRLAKPKRLLLFGDGPSQALLGKPLAAGARPCPQNRGRPDRRDLPSAASD